MGLCVDDLTEMVDDADKTVTISNRVPKKLKFGLDTAASNAETDKQVVIAAALHEGLESDDLDARIEDYEGDL